MIEALLFFFLMVVGGIFFLLVMLAVGVLKLVGLALGGAFGLARALAIVGLVVIVFMFKGVLLFLLLAGAAAFLVVTLWRWLFGGGQRRGVEVTGNRRVIDIGPCRMDGSAAPYTDHMRDRLRRMEQRLMNLETILGKSRGF